MKEEVWVSFKEFKPPLRKFRFRQLQQLAFSKNILWIDTKREYLTELSHRQSVCIRLNGEYSHRAGNYKWLSFGQSGKEMEYKALIRKLRAL